MPAHNGERGAGYDPYCAVAVGLIRFAFPARAPVYMYRRSLMMTIQRGFHDREDFTTLFDIKVFVIMKFIL
jgi:hypothetical protein